MEEGVGCGRAAAAAGASVHVSDVEDVTGPQMSCVALLL